MRREAQGLMHQFSSLKGVREVRAGDIIFSSFFPYLFFPLLETKRDATKRGASGMGTSMEGRRRRLIEAGHINSWDLLIVDNI
jgi:hypothetical protein